VREGGLDGILVKALGDGEGSRIGRLLDDDLLVCGGGEDGREDGQDEGGNVGGRV
jgi:hypothetical protein